VDWSLNMIYDYCLQLINAINNRQVDESICPWPQHALRCAIVQGDLIKEWARENNLTPENVIDARGRYATHKSPIGLFDDCPLDLEPMLPVHPDCPYDNCGLWRLANDIINVTGYERLMRWMVQTGGKARLATPRHIEYMRGQRRKAGMEA
jgi:hypothetical protein